MNKYTGDIDSDSVVSEWCFEVVEDEEVVELLKRSRMHSPVYLRITGDPRPKPKLGGGGGGGWGVVGGEGRGGGCECMRVVVCGKRGVG